MKLTPQHVDLALNVRRGLVRLAAVPEADRPAVTAVLRRTTDAQFALMAASKEYVTPRASRCIPRRDWHGRS